MLQQEINGNSVSLTYEFPELPGEERLRELILYIADKCEDDPKFGATKLNKILYHADFTSYQLYGEPITGVRYMRLPNGPVPRPMVSVREDMISRHEIVIRSRSVYKYRQQRIIALRDADLEKFTARQIAIVDQVIDDLRAQTATDVSNLSHGRAWSMVDDKDDIPYEAVFLSDEPATPEDFAWARAVISKHGWNI
ncbi:MAG: Panacea domain-containing protein [Armatimonadota bacterium]|nr:Panacea domain-containing protein [Armatimonadota bacterium]